MPLTQRPYSARGELVWVIASQGYGFHDITVPGTGIWSRTSHLVVETLERRCDIQLLAAVKLLLKERAALRFRVLRLVCVEEPLRPNLVRHVHIYALGPCLLTLKLESIGAAGRVETFLAGAIFVIHDLCRRTLPAHSQGYRQGYTFPVKPQACGALCGPRHPQYLQYHPEADPVWGVQYTFVACRFGSSSTFTVPPLQPPAKNPALLCWVVVHLR